MSTLSSKQILQRIAQGQNFHFDEPYHMGHECNVRLYMPMGEESGGLEECDVDNFGQECEKVVETNEVAGEISINPLDGSK